MKKITLLLLSFSCSAFALDQNPIAPPRVEVADKFGVNMESGQLARTLNTISIGGELGLKHNVQLYTDLWATGAYGYVDAFAGNVSLKKISENVINIVTNGEAIMSFQDTDTYQSNYPGVYVMRAYGPAGSHDFMVYQNGLVNNPTNTISGYTYRPVGDTRHSLIESPDRRYLTYITPDGTETKYDRIGVPTPWSASTGGRLAEITYPNGFKTRIYSKAVSTNTGFMLKYQLNSGWNTFDQVVGINLANQYCGADATTCSTSGWPTATFMWPAGSPGIFKQPYLASPNYLLKVSTNTGITEIQYQPENLCITNLGNEDAYCAANTAGLGKWSPRLRSIKTPESSVPNYQYTYKNIGSLLAGKNPDGYFPYWFLAARTGQITSATLNGTDTVAYNGPTINPGTSTRNSQASDGTVQIVVETAQYQPNVINSVQSKKGGTYYYLSDLRKNVDRFYPLAGGGPAQQYFYDGPRGNLSRINAIAPSTPMILQEAGYESTCISPKSCNKPLWVKDANGNQTDFTYHQASGQLETITQPANKNGVRAQTRYEYSALSAKYYDATGAKVSDTPIWLKTAERSCTNTSYVNGSCGAGDQEVVTRYEYISDNLFLTGTTVTADGKTLRTCFQYDIYGNQIGKTQPKAGLTSCPQP